ncbi:MAG: hypothetical protein F6K08_07775 [Okeania sp. SIO1H6]|nr:hypothetical protein [Okeania sp. SIO1H6]
MGRFKYTGSKKVCPVCHGERKDCRELETTTGTLYFCRTDNPSPDVVFRKYDIHNFGMYVDKAELDAQDKKQREEWQRQRLAEKEARLKAEKERRAKLLSKIERDIEIRKILNQLSLKPQHRQDLKRRGLTPKQIKQGMFRSVEQWQKLSEPISHRLAGVNISGRSLITQAGYICPIFNDNGLIIGWQLRLDNADDGGKYRWPTSNTKKRPDGPTAHLQNGEIPLTIHIVKGDKNLRLAEGVLKPYIAHCRRNQTYIGAAGGQFNQSKELLKQYIKHLSPEKIILTPDAGSRANKNVLRQYRKIANLLKSWRKELWVEDWGQGDSKDNCDVDEIEPNTTTTIIPFSEWDVPQSTPKKRLNKQITHDKWWEKIGATQAAQRFADWVSGKTRKLFGPPKQSELTSVTVSSDKQTDNDKNTIKYQPGHLPEFKTWVEMGCPTIIIRSSTDLPLLTAEAYLNGFRNLLWNIYAGGGKSWSVDKLDLSLFGIEPDIEFDEVGNVVDAKYPRIIYLDANYRNPSVVGIERKFVPLPAKHLGLKKDWNRLTALGNPHLIRVKKDEIPDIPENCPETYTFLETKNKGMQVFAGKDSPICTTCPLLYDKNGKIGCPLLLERQRIQQEENYISSSVVGFGKSRRSDILVIEEAEANIVPFETLKVSLTEVQKFVADKVDSAGLPNELKLALKAILVPIQKAISSINAENKKYGDAHIEVMGKLPTREELDRAIFDAYSQMWLTLSHPQKNSDRDKLDKKVLKTYSKDCLATSPIINGQFSLHRKVNLQKPNNLLLESFDLITGSVSHYSYWDTRKLVNYQKTIDNKIEKNSRSKHTKTNITTVFPQTDIWGKTEWQYSGEFDEDGEPIVVGQKNKWVIPSLEDIRNEVYLWLEKSLSMLSATHTPAEKQMLIQQKVHLNWLSPLLDVFCGNRKISLGITPYKELTFTRPSRHPQQLVNNSAFNIYIDATADVTDLRRLTGMGKPCAEKVALLTEELTIAEGLLVHWPGTVEDEGYQQLAKTVEAIREQLEQAKFDEAGKYILVVEMELPDYSNLTINLITDMGACGTQRRYDSRYANGNRIKCLVEAIANKENKPNSSTLFDFQGHIEQYQDIENIGRLGYHFRDNRASNQSQKDDLLICVGKQTRNLSAMAAQWQATTGQAVVPTFLVGKYGEWVVRQNMNETIQTYARLRANRRQNKNLTVYHIAPFNEMEISEIKRHYPGATVNVVSSFDVCPQAAPKGEQVKHKLVEAVFNLVKEGGKLTQGKVGEIVGIDRTGVGRKAEDITPDGFKRIESMCKMVIYSFNNNNKMHSGEIVVDVEFEESVAFLEVWIPALLQDLKNKFITAEELATEVLDVVKIFGRKILDFVSVDTLVGLLSGLLGVMPVEFFEGLRLALGPPPDWVAG